MNTQQIISSLAETLGCEEKEAVQYVDAVVRWMTEQTAENGELLIPGFGRFEVTKQMEYVRCDANTQKRYLVPPSLSVSFVPAPLLEGTKESTKNVFEAITEMLVAKEKVEKHVAERFPVTFFKGILDAMERGETVSVPQLGSFLLTKVRLAEKVFGKVSFTPDSAFDEWVNRPFSYLPEVELNDGVEFDDITIVSPYDSIHEPPRRTKLSSSSQNQYLPQKPQKFLHPQPPRIPRPPRNPQPPQNPRNLRKIRILRPLQIPHPPQIPQPLLHPAHGFGCMGYLCWLSLSDFSPYCCICAIRTMASVMLFLLSIHLACKTPPQWLRQRLLPRQHPLQTPSIMTR